MCVLARVRSGVSAFVCGGVRPHLFMKGDCVDTFLYILFSVLTFASACMCACLHVRMRLREHQAVDGAEMSGFGTGNSRMFLLFISS